MSDKLDPVETIVDHELAGYDNRTQYTFCLEDLETLVRRAIEAGRELGRAEKLGEAVDAFDYPLGFTDGKAEGYQLGLAGRKLVDAVADLDCDLEDEESAILAEALGPIELEEFERRAVEMKAMGVREEREACARLADSAAEESYDGKVYARDLAAAIRAQ